MWLSLNIYFKEHSIHNFHWTVIMRALVFCILVAFISHPRMCICVTKKSKAYLIGTNPYFPDQPISPIFLEKQDEPAINWNCHVNSFCAEIMTQHILHIISLVLPSRGRQSESSMGCGKVNSVVQWWLQMVISVMQTGK